MNQEVRVRFAPSPTGPQHIGGIRTALFNYLFAKKNKGKFILRIEDTDQSRYVEGSEQYLYDTLEWLSLLPDESPYNINHAFGPYRQSERKHIYEEYALQLIQNGKAYYAFDSPEEIDQMRERLSQTKVVAPQYNAVSRMTMKNSLTLPEDEVKKKLKSGEPFVIRIKVPNKEDIKFEDKVRGWISINTSTLDDKILIKSDKMPTYHFANVVDDHLMKITHVIRGEEWLPSTPIHLLLYEFFGWEKPIFAHLPLILKPDGVGKLSKRAADKEGFLVFPIDWQDPNSGETYHGYREKGFLPEALINFLALLGWSPGTNEEIMTIDKLIDKFSLERVKRASVKFDSKKVQWFNHEYIKRKPNSELVRYLLKNKKKNDISYTDNQLLKICEIIKERSTFINDIVNMSDFFFSSFIDYKATLIENILNPKSIEILRDYLKEFENTLNFEEIQIKKLLLSIIKNYNLKPGKILPLLRYALTGQISGPDLTAIITILGKQHTIERLQKFFSFISTI